MVVVTAKTAVTPKCAERGLSWLQVTTFKVRTIRSEGGSNDQASAALTWTTAKEGCLDQAAGGQGQLLARAMSIAGLQ